MYKLCSLQIWSAELVRTAIHYQHTLNNKPHQLSCLESD